MSFYTIVYRSVPIFSGMMSDDIAQFVGILDNAQLAVDDGRVTGTMLFNEDWFVQLLEGDEISVKERFQRNLLDPRHKNVEVLFEGVTKVRRFPNWTMAFVGDAAAIRSRFEDSPLTKPLVKIRGEEVVEFITALANDGAA